MADREDFATAVGALIKETRELAGQPMVTQISTGIYGVGDRHVTSISTGIYQIGA